MDNTPHYFHCATKGFQHSILFADVREFIAGMNRVAICFARARLDFPVIIIAFCLMDNHVHFILYGTRDDCLKFMALYHRLTMMWQTRHRQGTPIQENWEYDAWQIHDEEDLKEKIAYVFRNPTVAGLPVLPTHYLWSSAPLVFADASLVMGRSLGKMSSYELRNVFETRIDLPGDWVLKPDGLIWPGCFTDYKRVERLFGQPSQLMYALNQKKEAKINEELNRKSLSLPDQDVLQMAKDAARRHYNSTDLETLDLTQRVVLCTELYKRSGVNLKQLGRIFHIAPDTLKTIFHT